jgi:hypothetical protein
LAPAASESTIGVGRLNCQAMLSCLSGKRETRVRKTIASVALSLALMSSAAMANDRAGNVVSGALSKIGHAAHTLVSHIAKPFTARSRGSRRSNASQQVQRATEAGPSSHVSDTPPALRSQTDTPTTAPPTPRSDRPSASPAFGVSLKIEPGSASWQPFPAAHGTPAARAGMALRVKCHRKSTNMNSREPSAIAKCRGPEMARARRTGDKNRAEARFAA